MVPNATDSAAGGPYRPPAGTHDEAIARDGVVRPHARAAMAAVERTGIRAAQAAVQGDVDGAGIGFNSADGDEAFVVDAVPRVLEGAEWQRLERGLIQRTQALDLFVEDAYGPRTCVREGVVPARVIETADHLDPGAAAVRPPRGVWIGVAGLDLVRDACGTFRVLEDNVRTPSGFAYAMAAREAVVAQLGIPEDEHPRAVDGAPAMLLATLRAAAPAQAGEDPALAVLSDGPHNSAWWEHQVLAERMGVPLLTPADVEVRAGRLWRRDDATRPLDVLYRRTDAASSGSPIGRLVHEPMAAGALGVVNAFGTGVADDKLVHAYVEDLIRLYLREEPILPSVRSFDPMRATDREEVLDRLAELVVKPRNGAGGDGVVICPQEDAEVVDRLRRQMQEHPERFIAQELVMLSTHPTVIEGQLVPRHVDLRPFVFLGADRAGTVLPGGLTRVALDEGSLIVNSSRNGGAKDTWVLD